MIKINNLTKTFGKLVAVNNVSLEIEDNCCFALLGLNGAGKTTLINMLTTSINPTSGSAEINGLNLTSDVKNIRKIINISPQENAVAKNLTVKENLELLAGLSSILNPTEKIAKIIEDFGLKEKENARAKTLSGGQIRRLSIALAVLTDPQILFLDEPTLGLDVKARRTLWEKIAELKHRMTIVLTTHYLEEVEFLADRVGIISRGVLKTVGTVDEIKKATGKPTLEAAFVSLAEEE